MTERVIVGGVIESFADKGTEQVFLRQFAKNLPQDIQRTARRKLIMIDSATNLTDLQSPPGNHLEKLSGDRSGQYSIRINDQYRICFTWTHNTPGNVGIVDYHH